MALGCSCGPPGLLFHPVAGVKIQLLATKLTYRTFGLVFMISLGAFCMLFYVQLVRQPESNPRLCSVNSRTEPSLRAVKGPSFRAATIPS